MVGCVDVMVYLLLQLHGPASDFLGFSEAQRGVRVSQSTARADRLGFYVGIRVWSAARGIRRRPLAAQRPDSGRLLVLEPGYHADRLVRQALAFCHCSSARRF